MAGVPSVEMHVRLVFDGVQVRRGHVISMRPGDALAFFLEKNPTDQQAWEITAKVREAFGAIGVPGFPVFVFGPDQGLQVIRPGDIRRVELPDRPDEDLTPLGMPDDEPSRSDF